MIFIDTSFLIGLAIPRDELRPRSLAWSKRIGGALTTQFVLVEFVDSLSEPHCRARAHRLLQRLLMRTDFEVIPASSELVDAGMALHQLRQDKAWSLTDCISFHVMNERGIEVALTYDHHFEQAGFEALLRRDP